MRNYIPSLALAVMLMAAPALAQTGPVATSCKEDIAKFCADLPHNGKVRACLEKNKEQVSPQCRKALETTGGGKGHGRNGN